MMHFTSTITTENQHHPAPIPFILRPRSQHGPEPDFAGCPAGLRLWLGRTDFHFLLATWLLLGSYIFEPQSLPSFVSALDSKVASRLRYLLVTTWDILRGVHLYTLLGLQGIKFGKARAALPSDFPTCSIGISCCQMTLSSFPSWRLDSQDTGSLWRQQDHILLRRGLWRRPYCQQHMGRGDEEPGVYRIRSCPYLLYINYIKLI